jgi:cyclase
MKNTRIKISLVVLATLFGTTALLFAQAPGAAPAAPDDSKVEIKTTKVASNFYTLEGRGGTIGVLAGPDGVLLVDTQFATLTGKIVAAVKQISSGPINTHVHGDHTGGNENLGKMGAVIFSREELRGRLMNPAPAANGAPVMPAPAAALPLVTYRGRVTFHMNGEEVEAIPIQRAHTDGDTLVYFHNDNVLMTGDFYRSAGYPNIDRVNGGSLNGMIDGLGVVIGMAGPNTKIIPGHGPTVDRAAVIAHRDMILAVRDRVAQLVQQGKTPEEVVAAHPTSDYDAKVPMAPGSTDRFADRFVGQLYAELKPAK